MLASTSLPPTHPVLETKSADIGYSAPQQNFPQQDIRRCITKDSTLLFNGEDFFRSPDLKRTKPLMMHVGHDYGLFIIRDAVHSFPLYGGQELNSDLMAVAVFAAALSSAPENASVRISFQITTDEKVMTFQVWSRLHPFRSEVGRK